MYSPNRQEHFPKGITIALSCIIGCVITCYAAATLPVVYQRLCWEMAKPSDYYLMVSVTRAWRNSAEKIGVCVQEGLEVSPPLSLTETAENSELLEVSTMAKVFETALKCSINLGCEIEFDAKYHYPSQIVFEEMSISSKILIGEEARLKCSEVE